MILLFWRTSKTRQSDDLFSRCSSHSSCLYIWRRVAGRGMGTCGVVASAWLQFAFCPVKWEHQSRVYKSLHSTIQGFSFLSETVREKMAPRCKHEDDNKCGGCEATDHRKPIFVKAKRRKAFLNRGIWEINSKDRYKPQELAQKGRTSFMIYPNSRSQNTRSGS